MNIRITAFLFLALASSLAAQTTPPAMPPATPSPYALPPIEPPYYRVRYEASTQPKELIFNVSYTVWIPPGVKTLRGVIVHQHGCGEGSCKSGITGAFDLHWQALARKHECALLSPSYEQPEKANCSMWCDPRNGSDLRFLQALAALAAKSGHPELAHAPWALWGHSGGSCWVSTMLLLHPERIVAVWMRSGLPRMLSKEDPSLPPLEITPAVCAVPAMCNLGTKEGVTVKEGRFTGLWKMVFPFFTDFRAKGGLVGVAIDPLTSHECGNQRYLAIPWFDACLTARLPAKSGEALKPMPADSAWLATISEEGVSGEPQPAGKFDGDKTKAVWLPNEHIAQDWAQYVKDTAIADTTPPPTPTDVHLSANGELTWKAEADFETGLAEFIIERDGQELAHVPDKPVASTLGRPIFQKNGYSDTPTPPLAAMQFTDTTAKADEKHEYRIVSVNSVGLKSQPSEPAAR